jgi:hypothetical protein
VAAEQGWLDGEWWNAGRWTAATRHAGWALLEAVARYERQYKHFAVRRKGKEGACCIIRSALRDCTPESLHPLLVPKTAKKMLTLAIACTE